MFFGAGNSGNTSAMRPILCSKCFKFNIDFKNAKKKIKKIEKKFFVFEIISSELLTLNILYEGENACHQQSMCQQTILGFSISLKETCSNVIISIMINKYGKGDVVQIATVFRTIFHVVSRRVL